MPLNIIIIIENTVTMRKGNVNILFLKFRIMNYNLKVKITIYSCIINFSIIVMLMFIS